MGTHLVPLLHYHLSLGYPHCQINCHESAGPKGPSRNHLQGQSNHRVRWGAMQDGLQSMPLYFLLACCSAGCSDGGLEVCLEGQTSPGPYSGRYNMLQLPGQDMFNVNMCRPSDERAERHPTCVHSQPLCTHSTSLATISSISVCKDLVRRVQSPTQHVYTAKGCVFPVLVKIR